MKSLEEIKLEKRKEVLIKADKKVQIHSKMISPIK